MRSPLSKPKSLIPPSPEPVSIGGVTVRYDPERDVYTIRYTTFDGVASEVVFEPRTKATVVVEAHVRRVSDTTVFQYEYAIHNLSDSSQALSRFIVTAPVKVQKPRAPDEGWRIWSLPRDHSVLKKGRDGVGWSDLRKRKGIPPPPVRYASNSTAVKVSLKGPPRDRPLADWSPLGIAPGRMRAGFSFQSEHLPGIVECFAHGNTFSPITYGADGLGAQVILKMHRQYLEGRTVGPVLENPPSEPLKALSQIIEWVQEAEKLGWIGSEQLLGKITYFLKTARERWRAGKPGEAARELEALAALAEAENGTGISSELYAILKYDSEALRSLALSE